MYGAAGDGTTDDSDCMKSAVIDSMKRKCELRCSPGAKYYISKRIVVDDEEGDLIFNGNGSEIILEVGTTDSQIAFLQIKNIRNITI